MIELFVKNDENNAPIYGGVYATLPKYRYASMKGICGGIYSRIIHRCSKRGAHRKTQDTAFKNFYLPALRSQGVIPTIHSPYYDYYIHIQIISESV